LDEAAYLMNPHEILEISPGASAEEIKAAYHRMAKQWHPDRFTGEEKVVAEVRFRELAEAFNALKDSARRGAPASSPAAPQSQVVAPQRPAPSPVKLPAHERSPEDWFMEAVEARKAGVLERAMGLVQVAIRGDGKKIEYHQLYAQLLVETGRDPRQAVKAFETVLRMNPKDVEAMLRLAELFHGLGMPQRATRLQQTARELAPNHKAFRAEARKASQLKAKVPAPPEGLGEQFKSLIQKLFHRG
jgi:tetratricopeptide (TPR) repeat protein